MAGFLYKSGGAGNLSGQKEFCQVALDNEDDGWAAGPRFISPCSAIATILQNPSDPRHTGCATGPCARQWMPCPTVKQRDTIHDVSRVRQASLPPSLHVRLFLVQLEEGKARHNSPRYGSNSCVLGRSGFPHLIASLPP